MSKKNDKIIRRKIIYSKEICKQTKCMCTACGDKELFKRKFCKDLEDIVQNIPSIQKLYMWDSNERIRVSCSV